jgi:hypothetical protein
MLTSPSAPMPAPVAAAVASPQVSPAQPRVRVRAPARRVVHAPPRARTQRRQSHPDREPGRESSAEEQAPPDPDADKLDFSLTILPHARCGRGGWRERRVGSERWGRCKFDIRFERPYLKTSRRATVVHLKKYLCKKLGLPDTSGVCPFLSLSPSHSHTPLIQASIYYREHRLGDTDRLSEVVAAYSTGPVRCPLFQFTLTAPPTISPYSDGKVSGHEREREREGADSRGSIRTTTKRLSLRRSSSRRWGMCRTATATSRSMCRRRRRLSRPSPSGPVRSPPRRSLPMGVRPRQPLPVSESMPPSPRQPRQRPHRPLRRKTVRVRQGERGGVRADQRRCRR